MNDVLEEINKTNLLLTAQNEILSHMVNAINEWKNEDIRQHDVRMNAYEENQEERILR